MYKRGQITIFLIIAIIILASGIFYFYLGNQSTKEETEIEKISQISLSILPIQNYVESCIKSVGVDAITFISRHGGYFNLPPYSTKDYLTKTAYYFYINRNIIPSKGEIEQELSKYMNEELFFIYSDIIIYYSVIYHDNFFINKKK